MIGQQQRKCYAIAFLANINKFSKESSTNLQFLNKERLFLPKNLKISKYYYTYKNCKYKKHIFLLTFRKQFSKVMLTYFYLTFIMNNYNSNKGIVFAQKSNSNKRCFSNPSKTLSFCKNCFNSDKLDNSNPLKYKYFNSVVTFKLFGLLGFKNYKFLPDTHLSKCKDLFNFIIIRSNLLTMNSFLFQKSLEISNNFLNFTLLDSLHSRLGIQNKIPIHNYKLQKSLSLFFNLSLDYNVKIMCIGIGQEKHKCTLLSNIFYSTLFHKEIRNERMEKILKIKINNINYEYIIVSSCENNPKILFPKRGNQSTTYSSNTMLHIDNYLIFEKINLYKQGISGFMSFVKITKYLGVSIWTKALLLIDNEPYDAKQNNFGWEMESNCKTCDIKYGYCWLIDLKINLIKSSLRKSIQLCKESCLQNIKFPYQTINVGFELYSKKESIKDRLYYLTWYDEWYIERHHDETPSSKVMFELLKLDKNYEYRTFKNSSQIMKKLHTHFIYFFDCLSYKINLFRSSNNIEKPCVIGLENLDIPNYILRFSFVKKDYIFKIQNDQILKRILLKTLLRDLKKKKYTHPKSRIFVKDQSSVLKKCIVKNLFIDKEISVPANFFSGISKRIIMGVSKYSISRISRIYNFFLTTYPVKQNYLFYFNYFNYNIEKHNKLLLDKIPETSVKEYSQINSLFSSSKYYNYNWISEFEFINNVEDKSQYHIRNLLKWPFTILGRKIQISSYFTDDVAMGDSETIEDWEYYYGYRILEWPPEMLYKHETESAHYDNFMNPLIHSTFDTSMYIKKNLLVSIGSNEKDHSKFVNLKTFESIANIVFLDSLRDDMEKYRLVCNNLNNLESVKMRKIHYGELKDMFSNRLFGEFDTNEYLMDTVLNNSQMLLNRTDDEEDDSDPSSNFEENEGVDDDLANIETIKKCINMENGDMFLKFQNIKFEDPTCNPRETKFTTQKKNIELLERAHYAAWKKEKPIYERINGLYFDKEKLEFLKIESFDFNIKHKIKNLVGDKGNIETTFQEFFEENSYKGNFSLKGLDIIEGFMIKTDRDPFFRIPFEINLVIDNNFGLSLDYSICFYSCKRISRSVASSVVTEIMRSIDYTGYFMGFSQTTMLTPYEECKFDLSTAISVHNDGRKTTKSFLIKFSESDNLLDLIYYDLEICRSIIDTPNHINSSILSGSFKTDFNFYKEKSSMQLEINFDKMSDPFVHYDFLFFVTLGEYDIENHEITVYFLEDEFDFIYVTGQVQGIVAPIILLLDIFSYFIDSDEELLFNLEEDDSEQEEELLAFSPTNQDYFGFENYQSEYDKIPQLRKTSFLNFIRDSEKPKAFFYNSDEGFWRVLDIPENCLSLLDNSDIIIYRFLYFYYLAFKRSYLFDDYEYLSPIQDVESSSELKFRAMCTRNRKKLSNYLL